MAADPRSDEERDGAARDPEREGETDQPRISSVAEKNKRTGGLVALLVLTALLVGIVLVLPSRKDRPAESDKPEQVATPATAAGASSAPPQGPPPLPPRLPPVATNEPPVPRPGTPESPQQLSDAQRKAEARRRSPLIVYDKSGSGGGSAAEAKPNAGAMSDSSVQLIRELAKGAQGPSAGLGLGDDRRSGAEGYADRNREFAQQAAGQDVPTAMAKQLDLRYLIAQGKLIRATLETAVQSDLPGQMRAVVSQDVYSEDGNQRLIWRGSRLIGEYRSGLAVGQTRVFVVWNRLIRPDGISIQLASPGTDELGRAGLTGFVDRHFLERFGGAILLSIVGSLPDMVDQESDEDVVIRTADNFNRMAEEALRNTINIPPTIHVDQGQAVNVFVARDLDFAPVLGSSARSAGPEHVGMK